MPPPPRRPRRRVARPARPAPEGPATADCAAAGPSSGPPRCSPARSPCCSSAAASVGAIAAYQVRSDLGEGVALPAAEGQTGRAHAAVDRGLRGRVQRARRRHRQRRLAGRAAFGKRDATLNDVNILLHVSADHTNATAVSIPRDMVVPIPACAKEDGSGYYSAMSARPINEAWSYGGLSCVVSTVQSADRPRDPLRGHDLVQRRHRDVERGRRRAGLRRDADHGPLHRPRHPRRRDRALQGSEALAFLRTRHGVGDGSDLGRISSQQVYLSSLLRTVKSADTLTTPTKLYKLARAAASNMSLSEQLTDVTTMVQIGSALQDLPLDAGELRAVPRHHRRHRRLRGQGAADDRGRDAAVRRDQGRRAVHAARGQHGHRAESAAAAGDAAAGDAAAGEAATGDAAAPTGDAATGGAGTPTGEATAPAAAGTGSTEVISGLTGQTAADQTCSVANDG